MLEALNDSLIFFPRGLIYVALGVVVLVLAKFARDLTTRHKLDEEIVQKKNLSEALRIGGYFFGVVLVFVGAVYQPTYLAQVDIGLGFNADFGFDVLRVFLYSIAGIVALNLVRIVMDRLVLYKFDVEKEVIQDQNVGTGAAEFGINVATGLVLAGVLSGSGGQSEISEALISLAFFVLGQIVLVLFALSYELTTSFDIHEEIEKDNAAVGVAFGGNLIAIGLVMLKALSGDFQGWLQGITEFVIFAIVGFVLLYVLRLLVDLLLLPRVRVSEEMSSNKNVGVAVVESAVVISSSLILFFAI
jgi:uncharacterized membrane protein YjfL (UPF0719 family)